MAANLPVARLVILEQNGKEFLRFVAHGTSVAHVQGIIERHVKVRAKRAPEPGFFDVLVMDHDLIEDHWLGSRHGRARTPTRGKNSPFTTLQHAEWYLRYGDDSNYTTDPTPDEIEAANIIRAAKDQLEQEGL